MKYKKRDGTFHSADCIKGDTGNGFPSGGTHGQYLMRNTGAEAGASWESPVNSATETESGKVLDARMGKTLNDAIVSVESIHHIGNITSKAELKAALSNCYGEMADNTVMNISVKNTGSSTILMGGWVMIPNMKCFGTLYRLLDGNAVVFLTSSGQTYWASRNASDPDPWNTWNVSVMSASIANQLQGRSTQNGIDVLSTVYSPGLFYVTNAINTPTGGGTEGFLDITDRSGYGSTYRKVTWRPLDSNDLYVNYLANSSTWSGWERYLRFSDIMYAAGDSITMNWGVLCYGYVTNDGKQLYFDLPVEKLMVGVRDFSFTSLKITVRGVNGYVDIFNSDNPEVVGREGYTIAQDTRRTYSIQVKITKSSALTNVTNNTPVTVLAVFAGSVT